MQQNNNTNSVSGLYNYDRKPLPAKLGTIGMMLTIAGLALSIIALVIDPVRATYNSLLIFTYLMGIGMCSMFLMAIEYLTGAIWSVPFRRIGEYLAIVMFVAPVFALPVLFNMHDIFHWTHHEAVAADQILLNKSPYLNETFFYIRLALIIALMALFVKLLIGNSAKQDTNPDQKFTRKNVKLSAAFIPVFAISISVIGIDWIMSLEPHWFSTIFGVYYFAGSLLTTFATITLFALMLRKNGAFPAEIGRDHFYNLGAFMFAFTNFWAYIAFSQFMLIWYANMPEETFWFMSRGVGNWFYFSIGIVLVHFIIPYAGLLSQPSKSNYGKLKFFGIWILFAHYYDLFWLIMPTYSKEGPTFGWIELSYILFAVGLVITVFVYVYNKRKLIPVGDPKLQRALDFHL